MDQNNYYQELNVPKDAADQEIKRSYRKLAFEYHPDRNKDDAQASHRMKSINEAYAVLSDPEKRRRYDQLYQQYGDGARSQFRQSYSEQDIFRDSDIQQIFEEMARGFGLRGFDDIFKDFYGQSAQHAKTKSSGPFGHGFIFNTRPGGDRSGKNDQGIMGKMTRKILGKITGIYLPRQGDDLQDEITLGSEFALRGGPFAYYHRAKEKKLVVQIPKGVYNGQRIRLAGMGKEGTHGAGPGDLLLKVKIRTPLFKRIKKIIGLGG